MHNTLNLEHIQAPPFTPEAHRTRFDPELQNPAQFYVPEQRQPAEMFSRNTHLEVAASAQQATELATPADMFIVPQTAEQDAANQAAYVAAIAEKPNEVKNPEDRRYLNPQEALHEAMNAGAAIEMIRNAAA